MDTEKPTKSMNARTSGASVCAPPKMIEPQYNAVLKFKYRGPALCAGPRYVNNFTATRFSRACTSLSAFFLYLFPRSRERVY